MSRSSRPPHRAGSQPEALLPVDVARERMLAAVPILAEETAALENLRGQVLAVDILAAEDIPAFANSAMDGYAVRAADLAGASRDRPGRLRVRAFVPAGTVPERKVVSGEAARIMTGAMLPAGADAVVMIEETDGGTEEVAVYRSVRNGENIRPRGEAAQRGEVVIPRGTEIGAAETAMLAALGHTSARVIRRPRVALLSTGDELVPPDRTPAPGQIRDSNRYGLLALVAALGAIPVDLGLVGDDAAEIHARVAQGLEIADCLVTSGGVSVGDVDLTKRVLAEFGAIHSYRVAMKPGMPQSFGLAGGKPVFGLPGNPVSSLVVFDQFVRPALLKMAGHTRLFRPRLQAMAAEDMRKPAGKTHFLRGIVEDRSGTLWVRLAGPQGSGILRSLVLANAFVVLGPEMKAVSAGTPVPIELLVDRL